MQQANVVFNKHPEPGALDGVPREEVPDAGLDESPERLLSWLEIAERYYREYADRQS